MDNIASELVTLGVLRTCLSEQTNILSAKMDLMQTCLDENLNGNESLSEHTNVLSPKKTSDTVDSGNFPKKTSDTVDSRNFPNTKRVLLHTNEVTVISILNVSRCESRWAGRILFWKPFCLRFCRHHNEVLARKFKFKFKMKNTVDIVQKRRKVKFKIQK